jgi:predicted MFS family arabinose efflux permease
MVLAFSSLTYLFYPSRQASIPCLVPEGALMPANAAISANLIMGFALGPVVGGVVASMYGAEVSLMFAAVVMATGVVLIAMIREQTICTPARDVTTPGPSSVTEGLGEIRSRVRLWQGLMLVMFVMLAVGAGAVGLVFLGDDVLGLGEDGFPILLSALAVGTLAGAIFIGSLGTTPFKGRFLIGATILAGAMMFTISGVDQLVPALVVMFLMGIAAAMVLVPFTTMLQEDLGDTVMGTGFGLLSMGLTTPILVGVAVAGPLIEARGVQDLFMVMGSLLGIVGLVTLVASNLWSANKEQY